MAAAPIKSSPPPPDMSSKAKKRPSESSLVDKDSLKRLKTSGSQGMAVAETRIPSSNESQANSSETSRKFLSSATKVGGCQVSSETASMSPSKAGLEEGNGPATQQQCKHCANYTYTDVPGLRAHLVAAHAPLFTNIPGLQCGVKQFECQYCETFRTKERPTQP